MRLRSNDGAQVELQPMGHQFARIRQDGARRDWDANWLRIRGRVRLADGRGWTFDEPCLTTWEARELGEWLRGVTAGWVGPVPFGGSDEELIKVFTEPNLAFSLSARDEANATIRVHLSLESRPPWLREAEPGDSNEFFVEVSAPLAAITRAVDDWEQELTAFPER